MNEKRDIVIIGGGPAGLAAALAARESGAKDILIIEREGSLGGILKQCIHNGFGLHTFHEELTGPEYAERYIERVMAEEIDFYLDTMVLDITPSREVIAVNRERGLIKIEAGALILAMGCRERPRGSIGTPGTRPSGIYTAGTAQKLVNLEGLMPGRRVVILGSGDIGLIMARRMTFSGAEVKCCVELMPYSGGLKRNIVQCLDDYSIPLYLSHTVTDIVGRERIEGVWIAGVDEKLRPIEGTQRYIECDTLLLSVGLIPENELSEKAGVELSPSTSGAAVDERLETSVPGVFACGNVLHVHDLVDYVSSEAARAGRSAWEYVSCGGQRVGHVPVKMGKGVNALVPQRLSRNAEGRVELMFRPRAVYKNARVTVRADGAEVLSRKFRILAPGEMASLTVDGARIASLRVAQEITVEVEENDSGNAS